MTDVAPVIKEGIVAVRGHFMWRERYVVVHHGQVVIMRSKKGAIKAKIDLLDPSVRVIFHEDQSQLTIASHGRDTVLDCHDNASRDEWLSAVCSAKESGETDCESDVVMSGLSEVEHTVAESRIDDMEEVSCNETLLAFQDLRSSMLQCQMSISLINDNPVLLSEDSSEESRPPVIHSMQKNVLRQSEDERRRKCLSAVVFFIQTVQHGGKAILLHLHIFQSVGISLGDILLAIGEKQREKPRRASLSSAAAGMQRLNVSTFVRYILFHPVYAKRIEFITEEVDHVIDRFFPHCRLRRFSHESDQGSDAHDFELDLNLKPVVSLKSEGSSKTCDGTPPRPHAPAQIAPASMTKAEAMMKRKRHSFPNIFLPLQLVSSISTSRTDQVDEPLVQGKRSSSDHIAPPKTASTEGLPVSHDSDLFHDDSLPEPLRSVMWKHSSSEVAEQLSIFHQQQIAAVNLWEFLDKPKQAAKEITDHFNRLVTYFVWSVLVEDTAKDRAEVIESIIDVAVAASLASLHNFHLVMACVGCLGDTPLMPTRLPVTWKNVRPKFKAHLQELRTLCDHTGGFETLRKRQIAESSKGSCIPFIGVIGVTLERLRLIPYASDRNLVDLEKVSRQYGAVGVLENAMLKPYKWGKVATLQALVSGLTIEFASHRLLQLRSEQLLALETMQQSASSRHSSLYRSRQSQSDISGHSSLPFMSFRNVCSVLVAVSSTTERVQICVEALFADDRQSVTQLLRKFLQDFNQSICTSPCTVTMNSVRACVDSLRREIMSQKSCEVTQITGLDENSMELERGLYAAVVRAVTQPIATWLFGKVKHTFSSEDALVQKRLKEWRNCPDQDSCEVAPLYGVERTPAPLELLTILTDAVHHTRTEQDKAKRVHVLISQLALHPHAHPFSVLTLLQQSLDVLFLPRELRDALDLFETAITTLRKTPLKRSSLSSTSFGSLNSRSSKSIVVQPAELVVAS